jgi:hypothetical protein
MNANRRRVLAYAEQGDWDDALELIEASPALAKAQDDFGMLPLHWACTEPTLLLDVVKALLDAFPEGCTIENLSGMLPLHVAIKSKMPGLHINALLQVYPEAALKKDGNGKYPVELAMDCNLPKFTLDLIRKAGGRAMRSTSLMDVNSFDVPSLSRSTSSIENQSDDEEVPVDHQKDAFVKARSLGSLMLTREASMYARLLDEKMPEAMDPMQSAEISSQLRDLLNQLQQLSVDIRSTTSAASTASTYRSSFSSSSSGGLSLNSTSHSVLWNPGDKLGIDLEPISDSTGARIRRFGSKSSALGVEALDLGDILVSINGTSVTGASFASITRFMKNSKVTCTLCFSKPSSFSFATGSPMNENQASDNDAELFAKVATLLDTTMKKVSAVEETVRLSSAMSFIA